MPIIFISIIHTKDRVPKDWGTEKWTILNLTGKRSVTWTPSYHPAFILCWRASWKNSTSGAEGEGLVGQGWGEGSVQGQGGRKVT